MDGMGAQEKHLQLTGDLVMYSMWERIPMVTLLSLLAFVLYFDARCYVGTPVKNPARNGRLTTQTRHEAIKFFLCWSCRKAAGKAPPSAAVRLWATTQTVPDRSPW